MFWRNNPLLRILILLAPGIGWGLYGPPAPYLLPVLLFGLAALAVWHTVGVTGRDRTAFALGLYVWFFLFGIWRAQLEGGLSPDRLPDGYGQVVAVVESIGRPGTWHRLETSLLQWDSTGLAGHGVGAQVYLEKAPPLQVGDTLLARARFRPIPPPANPMAFDYAAYMRRRGIFRQAFVPRGAYTIRSCLPSVGSLPKYRARALEILQRHLQDPAAFGVGAALILGYRESLDPDLRRAYQDAGAMHILAVSGMHVGLVYLLAGGLLMPLGSLGRAGRFLIMFLRLGAIWCFIGLAGWPLSAQRAGVMFSLFGLGQAGFRQGMPLNSWALAALILLCLRPGDLSAVGFQLSFLAVGGIIILQPAIARLWAPRHFLLRYVWQMLTVSLAAQAATGPLVVYYFHQFPLYFLLSGLLAVPAATAILGLGLLLLALAGVPIVAPWLGSGLQWLLVALNRSTRLIAELPGAKWEGIWLDGTQLAACLLLLALLMVACLCRDCRWFIPGLAALWLCLLMSSYKLEMLAGQRLLVVYAVNGEVLIDRLWGRLCFSISSMAGGAKDEQRVAARFRQARGVVKQGHFRLGEGGMGEATYDHWIECGGLLIGFQQARRQKLDLLYLRRGASLRADWLRQAPPRWVVLADDLPGSHREQLRALCRDEGIPCHDLAGQGALVLSEDMDPIPWR